MLDIETKRRIDSARDILVGKVPDPKSQVEQITIALIYKFMDDMDLESEELGGERSFFKGEYEKYAWRKIFDPRMGGFEILNLYSEAIMKMNVNPNIPQLFRDIFKNAYLPYRDPETLKAFLKIIHEFNYDNSERLGDAFEYLLSVLGSQGDAGQFRTPRHIIDFMVAILDPRKDEVILDPACGTAGFLISAYKHIIKLNSSNYDPETDVRTFEAKDQNLSELIINSKNYKGDKLTPDERNRLARNIMGYDISPDMVRLSLVNMYLHGLHAPRISEYDTLTSEDNWNEYGDVILANPPFMSPKGGIRPHKRFSIPSNRSEVLFVDYIADHLTPNGRAAVIVPEGIIFQSGTAYKKLRKKLVDDYLVGVISLPAGVFNPYSGVKTSILWMDKTIAKKTDKILFVKIENDGFDLGAQRKPIKQNDLPEALKNIISYKKDLDKFTTSDLSKQAFAVEKVIITESSNCNLSGERFRIKEIHSGKYPLVTLAEISFKKPEYGSGAKKVDYNGKVRYIRITDIEDNGRLKNDDIVSPSEIESQYFLNKNDLLFARSGSVGRTYLHKTTDQVCQYAGYLIRFFINQNIANPDFVFYLTKSPQYDRWVESMKKSGTISNINAKEYSELQIPLPPLSVQEEIVAEIESYQKIIDGARQVVENYKPRIDIDPDWPMVELGEVCDFVRGPFGGSLKKEIFKEEGVAVYEQSHAIYNQFEEIRYFIDEQKYLEMERFEVLPGDLIMSCSGTMGKVAIVPNGVKKGIINQALLKLTPKESIDVKYLKLWMESENFQDSLKSNVYGAAIQNVASVKVLQSLKISLPKIEIQKEIISEIELETSMIDAAKKLVDLYEQKIKDRIAKVWGDQ